MKKYQPHSHKTGDHTVGSLSAMLFPITTLLLALQVRGSNKQSSQGLACDSCRSIRQLKHLLRGPITHPFYAHEEHFLLAGPVTYKSTPNDFFTGNHTYWPSLLWGVCPMSLRPMDMLVPSPENSVVSSYHQLTWLLWPRQPFVCWELFSIGTWL